MSELRFVLRTNPIMNIGAPFEFAPPPRPVEHVGRIYPAGSHEGRRLTGHSDAVMVLPGPDGARFFLTLAWMREMFRKAEAEAAFRRYDEIAKGE